MRASDSIRHLKRKARLLSRRDGIALHAALDAVAAGEGFARWSLLAAKAPSAAAEIYARLRPGDLLLIGARPGQGKTLMALRLAVEAMARGRRSVVFTLEDTERDIAGRFAALGIEPGRFGGLFASDCSDAICADHIVGALDTAAPGTFAVVDYLQLLDQRRDKADLGTQIRTLKAFARRREVVMAVTAQIDRRYDPLRKRLPDIEDVRLPNPLDLALFDKACFLGGGGLRCRELN
ncbi:DNA helicase [Enterovirga rhinocerotis]|uniref:DnaB helicase-like protein n=1 Tax=Enterovirga rhinocerotis TaxID=1339210 RepID=A0A4R7BUV2_9HYPH|nr:DNA helicase [Enterovirga rhinocerotis]TDR89594.1 DnaB helicase-like protein [Enterovirga rhinocerotis]